MDPSLEKLAAAFGVAVEYEDWQRRRVEVPETTVRRVLAGLGVDVDRPEEALREADERQWRRLIPPTVVAVEGAGRSRGGPGARPRGPCVELTLENGSERRWSARHAPARPEDGPTRRPTSDERDRHPLRRRAGLRRRLRRPWATGAAVVAGHRRVRSSSLPAGPAAGLPPAAGRRRSGRGRGVHRRRSRWSPPGRRCRRASAAPGAGWCSSTRCARPVPGGSATTPTSPSSPGGAAAEQGAGAACWSTRCTPSRRSGPVQNSPYYPASRRFSSPLYLRPELLPEYARRAAGRPGAASTSWPPASTPDGDADTRIDRDAVWAAKRAALELLFALPGRAARRRAEPGADRLRHLVRAGRAARPGLARLAGRAARPARRAVDARRAQRLAERVAFHAWLQRCCDEQLAAAQRRRRRGGHAGRHRARPRRRRRSRAAPTAGRCRPTSPIGFTVGAPPDAFNQQGQDWRLPPWRPDRLAETGYAPFRDMVRAVLRQGRRPAGRPRARPVPALVGARGRVGGGGHLHHLRRRGDARHPRARGGAGRRRSSSARTSAPCPDHVRSTLSRARRARLGRAVVREGRGRRDAAAAGAVAGAGDGQRHDPRPADGGRLVARRAGAGAGRARPADPAARTRTRVGRGQEKAALLAAGPWPTRACCRERPEPTPDEQTVALALHGMLARSPSRVVLAALGDAVGDVRQPNLPGTTDEYPNWRLPVADARRRPVPLEELRGRRPGRPAGAAAATRGFVSRRSNVSVVPSQDGQTRRRRRNVPGAPVRRTGDGAPVRPATEHPATRASTGGRLTFRHGAPRPTGVAGLAAPRPGSRALGLVLAVPTLLLLFAVPRSPACRSRTWAAGTSATSTAPHRRACRS